MILHGYWRSGAAYRVRIALNLKGLSADAVPVNLREGEQRADAYRALNPQGLVPALEVEGRVLTQSSAIIEWLEETHTQPPLLPAEAADRATVRGMAAIVGADIHPLNNLRVLNALRDDLHLDEQAVKGWIIHWITEGFEALETMVARHGRGFCFGDAPGMADCFLVPQVYSAERFEVDLAAFPRLRAVADRANAMPAFAAAHPSRQADAVA